MPTWRRLEAVARWAAVRALGLPLVFGYETSTIVQPFSFRGHATSFDAVFFRGGAAVVLADRFGTGRGAVTGTGSPSATTVFCEWLSPAVSAIAAAAPATATSKVAS